MHVCKYSVFQTMTAVSANECRQVLLSNKLIENRELLHTKYTDSLSATL